MRTDEFWLIVQRGRRTTSEESAALALLTTELQRLHEPALNAFEQHVRKQIEALDTELLRDIATQLWVLSDEGWLHLRAWCVSQGCDFLRGLTLEPSRVLRALADLRSGPFDPPNGELFLYCTEYARVARNKAVA